MLEKNKKQKMGLKKKAETQMIGTKIHIYNIQKIIKWIELDLKLLKIQNSVFRKNTNE